MSDETDNDGALEIDEQWEEARIEAGLEPEPGELQGEDADEGAILSPYLILYAGFFMGPISALISSLLVGPRDLSVRRVSVMLGICGAIWCMLQGTTVLLASSWSSTGLQMMRSSLNFAGGALLVLFWRREVPARFHHSRRAIGGSIAVGVMLLVGFVFLPSDILGVLGR